MSSYQDSLSPSSAKNGRSQTDTDEQGLDPSDEAGDSVASVPRCPSSLRRWLRGWRPVVLLLALGLLTWGGVVFNHFTYDDLDVINPRLKIFFYRPWLFVSRDYFRMAREMSWRPVTTGSYVADIMVWGRSAAGFHFTNLLLHLAAVLLFWRLVRRTTGSASAALVGAVVALVHPAAGSAVTMVGFREELLVAVGFLAALECAGVPRRVRWNGLWGIAGLFCVAFALLGKETGAVIPVATILVWLAAKRKGCPSTASGRRVAVLVTVQAVIVLIYVGLYFGPLHPMFEDAASKTPYAPGPVQALATFFWVHLRYVGMMVWPFGWAAHHPVQTITSVTDIRYLIGGPVLAAVAVLGVVGYVRGRWAAVAGLGLLWWGLFLAPVSGLAPLPNPMADRYLYFSLFGFAWVMAWVWWRARVGLRRMRRRPQGGRAITTIATLIAVVVALVWVRQSVEEVLNARSVRTLWAATLRAEPGSRRAMHNLAIATMQNGDFQESATLFERLIQLEPKGWKAMISLASDFDHMGRPAEAEKWIRKAIEIAPKSSAPHEALISHFLYGKRPDVEAARKALEAAQQQYHVEIKSVLVEKVKEESGKKGEGTP